jgi:hypothetical protein
MGPKEVPETKIDLPTDRRSQNQLLLIAKHGGVPYTPTVHLRVARGDEKGTR